MLAILTASTCGEACWHAREELCRCSCGGANHGCLKRADGIQPVRTCRVSGVRWKLAGVGPDVDDEAARINMEAGIQYRFAHTARQWWGEIPAAITRPASSAHRNWPECAAGFAEYDARRASGECAAYYMRSWPRLLWVRAD